MGCLSDFAYSTIMCVRPRARISKTVDGGDAETKLQAERWPLPFAGILSRTYFVWVSPLIEVGIRRPLQFDDMWQIGEREACTRSGARLAQLWDKEVHEKGPEHASFASVAWRSVRWDIFITFCFKMGWLVTAMVGNSFLLSRLINFFGSSEPQWHGLLYALGFVLAEAARSAFVNQHWLIAVIAGVQLRAGVRALVYNKLTRLRGTGLPSSTAVNMLLSDAGRMLEACNYVEFIFSTPVTVVVTMAVMITVIGPSAVAGFVILLLFSPLQARIGAWLGSLRRETVKITDERVRLVNELLSGIRLLKLYGFEGAFGERLASIRGREVAMLTKAAAVRAINNVAVFALPVLVTLGVFATTTLTGGQLNPSSAFVVLALFNVARFPLGVLPQSTRQVSEALVAAKRIQAFLLLPEQAEEDKPILLPANGSVTEETQAALLSRSRTPDGRGSDGSSSIRLPQEDTAVWAHALTCEWERLPTPPAGGGRGQPASNKAGPAAAVAAAGLVHMDNPMREKEYTKEKGAVHEITLDLRKGTCTAIVGAVASGKSSLLSALLGHMKRTSGCAAVRGRVAFCAQSAWIPSGTVRECILLGQEGEVNEERYRTALRVCALEPDLAALPSGDATEIGERGINLSGGQKARIALARAIYSDADVHFLDDPLAAVDAHTAAHLWKEAISGCLVGRGKTVLLVTHAAHILPHAHEVLVMEAGRIVAQGSYESLHAQGVDMRTRTEEEVEAAKEDREEGKVGAGGKTVGEQGPNDIAKVAAQTEQKASSLISTETSAQVQKAAPPLAQGGTADKPSAVVGKGEDGAGPAAASTRGKLLVAEDRNTGSVTGSTFAQYFIAAGGLYTGFLIFLVLVIGKGSRQVSDWFLSVWTTSSAIAAARGDPLTQDARNTYLWQYSITVIGVMVCTLLQGLLFAAVTLRASRTLHDAVSTAILRAKLTWFDTQPLGRILNRFTGDIDQVDTALPSTLETCCDFLTSCALSIVLIAAVFPWFLIALVPLLAIFVFITQVFRRVARELKRLDNMSRGPLVSAVGTTASGLATLRCFGVLDRYGKEYARAVDTNTRTYACLYVANRWVAVRVDWVTTFTAGTCALLAVLSRDWLTPALAGLSMSYSLSLAGVLQYCMRLTTETESYFTSVERLTHYTSGAVPFETDIAEGAVQLGEVEAQQAIQGMQDKYGAAVSMPLLAAEAGTSVGSGAITVPVPVPHAAGGQHGGSAALKGQHSYYKGWAVGGPHWSNTLTAANWPAWGLIQFQHVSVRYRPGLPLVLRDLTFTVAPGSFVGIVGRTGSGKSTLALTLLRVLDPQAASESDSASAAGRVLLDGVDIARISVYQLRRSIAIIPQDPTLFNGTLRSNLDMFGQHEDAALWACLSQARLQEWAEGLPGQLAYPITEGGGNLSVGQRQLVCLARALLRRAKVVMLDEATASLDRATDGAIQSALRASARTLGSTVLVVAHRLNTVLDCDRVLGLQAGCMVEYDAPAALLGLAPSLEERSSELGPASGPGLLAGLVADTGEASAAALKAQALAAYTETAAKAAKLASTHGVK